MHIGRNINRLRSFRGIKQADMATRLKMTQQNYSHIENMEKVDDDLLKRIAEVLDLDVEFIREMPEVPYVYNNNQHAESVVNYQFNPLEKIIELYERLLEKERKRITELEAQINGKSVKKSTAHTKKANS